MRHSRETSPMPANIDDLLESVPRDSIGYYQGVNLPPMYRDINRFKRFGNKLLYGAGALAGLYGAYKLGQHMKPGLNTVTNRKRNNRTRSGS